MIYVYILDPTRDLLEEEDVDCVHFREVGLALECKEVIDVAL